MTPTLSVHEFHQLPESDQADILQWFKRYVCPDRYVISAELEREGRIALQTVRMDGLDRCALYRGPCPNDVELLTTRIYTTSQPPRAMLRAMLDKETS